MNLVELTPSCRIEAHCSRETTLHFGRLSIHIPIEDLMVIDSMFNPRKETASNSDKVCSVLQNDAGKYIFSYRSIMFTLCGKALAQLASLIEQSVGKYNQLFDQQKAESMNEIETILSEIEKSNRD